MRAAMSLIASASAPTSSPNGEERGSSNAPDSIRAAARAIRRSRAAISIATAIPTSAPTAIAISAALRIWSWTIPSSLRSSGRCAYVTIAPCPRGSRSPITNDWPESTVLTKRSPASAFFSAFEPSGTRRKGTPREVASLSGVRSGAKT
jgi:hypothetical protein